MNILNRLKFTWVPILGISLAFASCKEAQIPVVPGEASIITFTVNGENAIIDESAKSITHQVSPTVDLKTIAPVLTLSAGATSTPPTGLKSDFTNPVSYVVTDKSGTVRNTYKATVTQKPVKRIAFVGWAAQNTPAAWNALNGTDYKLDDDRTAAEWFFKNMPSETLEATYLSISDVAKGADLKKFNAIWIQYDGGWWGGEVAQFPNNKDHCIIDPNGIQFNAPCSDLSKKFAANIKTYYEGGGNLLLGNYAGMLVDEIGVVSTPDAQPNNAFGGINVELCCTADNWGARWAADPKHPIFDGVITATDPNCEGPYFVMLEKGSERKNRSAQYNLNFGPWAPNGDADPLAKRKAAWLSIVGGVILQENCGGNEPQSVLWEAKGTKGKVVAHLSGLYDWYVGTSGPANNNIRVLTKNTLTFLTK